MVLYRRRSLETTVKIRLKTRSRRLKSKFCATPSSTLAWRTHGQRSLMGRGFFMHKGLAEGSSEWALGLAESRGSGEMLEDIGAQMARGEWY